MEDKGAVLGWRIRGGISEDSGEAGRRMSRGMLEDDSNGEIGHIGWREKGEGLKVKKEEAERRASKEKYEEGRRAR